MINLMRRITKNEILLPLVAVMAILILSVCAGQTSQPVTDATTPAQVTGSDPAATTPVIAADTATPGAETAAISFSKDVQPILQSRCISCHGGERTEKKLNMTSYENLMAGSEKGAVVIPGDVDNSLFIQMILQGKMPKRGPKLLPDQVKILTDWVAAGALNN